MSDFQYNGVIQSSGSCPEFFRAFLERPAVPGATNLAVDGSLSVKSFEYSPPTAKSVRLLSVHFAFSHNGTLNGAGCGSLASSAALSEIFDLSVSDEYGFIKNLLPNSPAIGAHIIGVNAVLSAQCKTKNVKTSTGGVFYVDIPLWADGVVGVTMDDRRQLNPRVALYIRDDLSAMLESYCIVAGIIL
jgi:hypothetical protein